MIKVENLTFSYPSSYDPIFENVSVQIDRLETGICGGKWGRTDDVFNFLMDRVRVSGENYKIRSV